VRDSDEGSLMIANNTPASTDSIYTSPRSGGLRPRRGGVPGARSGSFLLTLRTVTLRDECKGTVRAFGQSCDAQFATIGAFTPGPGCM
jgi:hypothetical protein